MNVAFDQRPTEQERHQGIIMIVDDHPANLGFLFEYLERSGFKVLVAMDGEEALSQLEHAAPDLILLDIMMPGLDGFQTCELIKRSPKIQDIPVIFMSARTDPQDKVRGFRVGAADYVEKPVHKEEVLARISAHIAVRRLQREMREQYEVLQQRQQELEERNEELDAFSHMVAHDLRNALHQVLGYSDMLLDQPVESWDERDVQDLTRIRDAALRMQDVIESMLALARMSRGRMTLMPIDMATVVSRVLRDLEWSIVDCGAIIELPDVWPSAVGHAPWLERVWSNYIGNGLKYGGQPPRLQLGATIDSDNNMVRFFIRDHGPGLNEASLKSVFQPFVRVPGTDREGFGIGLAIVHRVIKRLGGTIDAKNLEDGGCEFSFTLPRAQ